jgi:hypothetical protein
LTISRPYRTDGPKAICDASSKYRVSIGISRIVRRFAIPCAMISVSKTNPSEFASKSTASR